MEHVLTWSTEQVTRWLASVGYPSYEIPFTDNDVTGDVLVHLDHEALKDLSVESLGHRIGILKATYNLKVEHGLPIEEDDFKPSNAGVNGTFQGKDTQVQQLLEEVVRLNRELARLKEEVLPMLPPQQRTAAANGHGYVQSSSQGNTNVSANSVELLKQPRVQRRPSQIITKYLGANNANFSSSASIKSAKSPLGWKLRANSRSPSSDSKVPFFSGPSSPVVFAHTTTHAQQPSETSHVSSPAKPLGLSITTPTAAMAGIYDHGSESLRSPLFPPEGGVGPIRVYGDRLPGRENEMYKTFKITQEDLCHKVVETTLRKYEINDSWRNYTLMIVHNGRERYIDYTERPLPFFQKLQQAGESPILLLRHNRHVKHRPPPRFGQGPSDVTSILSASQNYPSTPTLAHHFPNNPTISLGHDGSSSPFDLHIISPPLPPRRTSSLTGGNNNNGGGGGRNKTDSDTATINSVNIMGSNAAASDMHSMM